MDKNKERYSQPRKERLPNSHPPGRLGAGVGGCSQPLLVK